MPHSTASSSASSSMSARAARSESCEASWGTQVGVLFWKHNIVLRRRSPCLTALAIVAPALAVLITALLYAQSRAQWHHTFASVTNTSELVALNFPTRCGASRESSSVFALCKAHIFFSPRTPFVEKVLRGLHANLGGDATLRGFDNATALVSHMYATSKYAQTQRFAVGVVFTDGGEANGVKAAYTIVDSLAIARDRILPHTYDVAKPSLVALKIQVDAAILAAGRKSDAMPGITVKIGTLAAPRSLLSRGNSRLLKSVDDTARLVADAGWNAYTRTILATGFVPLFLVVFSLASADKHMGQFAPLRALGVCETAYWVSIASLAGVLSALAAVLSGVALVAARTQYSLFASINVFVFAILQLFFGVSFPIFGCLFVAGASKARASNALAAITVVATPIAVFCFSFSDTLTHAGLYHAVYKTSSAGFNFAAAACSILLPMFHYGKVVTDWMLVAQGHAGSARHFGVVNVVHEYRYDDQGVAAPSAIVSLLEMAAMTVIYLASAWYLNQVIVGKSGGAKSVFFPFFWRTYMRGESIFKSAAWDSGVVFEDVGKTFRSWVGCGFPPRCDKKTAVKNVSMALQAGKMYALLGQRDAGKSTLLKLLSGGESLGSGHISVFGKTATHEMDEIRRVLGLCPQQDALWCELTPAEHVQLYARLKGASVQIAGELVDEKLDMVALGPASGNLAVSLDQGMRRRLSVALSTIGNPKLWILDEPTAGMDKINQRKMWEVIQRCRKNTVVVVATNSVHEAEQVGDVVTVIKNGSILAMGAPLALKNQHGSATGVEMSMVPELAAEHKALARALRQAIPEGRVVSGEPFAAVRYRVPPHALYKLRVFLKQVQSRSSDNQQYPALREWAVHTASLEHVLRGMGFESAQPPPMQHRSGSDLPSPVAHSFKTDVEQNHDIMATSKDVDDFVARPTAWSQLSGLFLRNVSFQKRRHWTNAFLVVQALALTALVNWLLASVIKTDRCPNGGHYAYDPSALRSASDGFRFKDDFVSEGQKQLTCNLGPLVKKTVAAIERCSLKTNGLCVPVNFKQGSSDNFDSAFAGTRVWVRESRRNGSTPLAPVVQRMIAEQHATSETLEVLRRLEIEQKSGAFSADSATAMFNAQGSVKVLGNRTDIRRTVAQSLRDMTDLGMTGCGDSTSPGKIVKSFRNKYDAEAEIFARVPSAAYEIVASDVGDKGELAFNYLYHDDAAVSMAHRTGSGDKCERYPLAPNAGTLAYAAYARGQRDDDQLLDLGLRIAVGSMTNAYAHEYLSDDSARILANFVTLKHVGYPRSSLLIVAVSLVALVSAMFSVFVAIPLADRRDGVLPFFRITGIKVWTYWLSNYLFDFFLALPIVLVVVVSITAHFQLSPGSIGMLVAVSFAAVHSMIGMAFLLASVVQNAALVTACSFAAPLFFAIAGAVGAFPDVMLAGGEMWANMPLLLVIPPVAFAYSVRQLLDGGELALVGAALALTFAVGTLCVLAGVWVGLLVEHGSALGVAWRSLFRWRRGKTHDLEKVAAGATFYDEEVEIEKVRVAKNMERLAVRCKEVDKADGAGGGRLRNFNLGVKRGECVALVGHDGSGKSAVMGILTGQTRPTRGRAFILDRDAEDATAVIGFCPRNDAFMSGLTAEENLVFFARVRGAATSTLLARRLARHAARRAGIADADVYSRRVARDLPPLMRRRLALAIAVLGNPAVLVLEDPLSAGSDAQFARVVSGLSRETSQPAVVITARDTAEIQGVQCTRVGVITDGELRCLGAPQSLIERYGGCGGRGRLLAMRYENSFFYNAGVGRPDDETAHHVEQIRLNLVDALVQKATRGARLDRAVVPERSGVTARLDAGGVRAPSGVYKWSARVTYRLAPSVDLAAVFGALVESARENGVLEWELRQSTLQDVCNAVSESYVRMV